MCYSETHPLAPFLPHNAKILILGSFPPPKKRWCMDFFYPNWNNDFWRIMGHVAKADKNYFIAGKEKRFDKEKIEKFCNENGIALYDTAEKVIRLKNNASDNFLQVVTPLDPAKVLSQIPACKALVVTGQKAMDTLLAQLPPIQEPSIGSSTPFTLLERDFRLYRMPSSSRAYPKPLEEKAVYYKKMFEELGMLH